MNSPRTLRLARLISSQQRLSVHVDPKTKQTYKYLERDKALLKYQGQENTFGTFTSIFKLGINPSSTYNTPTGVYAYPIDYIIETYDKDTGIFRVPFPSPAKQEFVHVFSVPDISRCLIFRVGDSEKVTAYRAGISAEETKTRIDGAQQVIKDITKYYSKRLSKVDLGNKRELFNWFNRGDGVWSIITEAFPGILDNHTSDMIEDFFGIDLDAIYHYDHIGGFLESARGTRFQEIVKSGAVPDTEKLRKDITDYYQRHDSSNIVFPYEDRFKEIFFMERGSGEEYYDEFKREEVLFTGQRVVCDEAYVWNAARHLSNFNPRKWTGYLRQMGFIGVIDYGTKTIHENEETQVVFFDPSSIKLEETIDNRVPQYEVEDKTRFNISNWSRKPDENRDIANVIDYASVDAMFRVEDFVKETNRAKTSRDSYSYVYGKDYLTEALRNAGIVFKYLGWVTSHIRLLDDKPFWLEEIKRSVDRAKDCLAKLSTVPDEDLNLYSRRNLSSIRIVLTKIVRNFSNWK